MLYIVYGIFPSKSFSFICSQIVNLFLYDFKFLCSVWKNLPKPQIITYIMRKNSMCLFFLYFYGFIFNI